MSKISTFPIVTPTSDDLVLGTDIGDGSKTKNFTVGSIASLATGQPTVVTKTFTSAELLNFTGGGAVNVYELLPPPGEDKVYLIDSFVTKMTFGTVAYDFTDNIYAGPYGISQSLVRYPYLITKEAMNINAGFYNAEWLPVETPPTGGVFSLKGGNPLFNNTGFSITAAFGGSVTVGDGILLVRVAYRVLSNVDFAQII